VTVEEALLAAMGLVAIVLLFLGLAQALEGDTRARLRARRRRFSRRGAAHATSRRRAAVVSGSQTAARRGVPVGVVALAEAAGEPEPGGAAGAEDLAWRERVAGHIRRREFGESRALIDSALGAGDMTVGSAEFVLEVCSTAIARDLWRLRRAARRGGGDEAPIGGALDTIRAILESEVAAALAAETRQRLGRRLWRSHTRLGLRRWRRGEFEPAVETLFGALSVPGLDDRRRRLARDLLVRTLEDAAGQSLELIPQLRGDGDRAAATEQAQRVLEHIQRAREDGIPAEDLAVAASRVRQLLEHIEHTSVQ
jgi:hypothetical protein